MDLLLTIDDCPLEDFKKKIDFLYANNIFAVLFCTGNAIKNNFADILYAVNKGFLIGNHSLSHVRFSFLSLKEIIDEILNTEDIIEEVYASVDKKRQVKLFRFPFNDRGGKHIDNKEIAFEKEKKIFEFIRSEGFRNPITEDLSDFPPLFDLREYCIKDKSELFSRLDVFLEKQGVYSFLMHDEMQLDLFFEVMGILKSRNELSFLSISEEGILHQRTFRK